MNERFFVTFPLVSLIYRCLCKSFIIVIILISRTLFSRKSSLKDNICLQRCKRYSIMLTFAFLVLSNWTCISTLKTLSCALKYNSSMYWLIIRYIVPIAFVSIFISIPICVWPIGNNSYLTIKFLLQTT